MDEQNKNLMIPGAIIIAGVIVAVAIVYSGGFRAASEKPSAGSGAAAGTASEGGGVIPDLKELAADAPFLGNPSAKVVMVEFADFQCPFCGRFFKSVKPQIVDKYIKTGKVKFVYRDFAFLGQESVWAAEAARCANDQGKFWDYHDYLYNHQSGENQGAFSKANLKKFAGALGLNQADFDSCLDSGKYTDAVQKETDAGRRFGVSGTPATFINGRLINGALPFEQFAAVIEQELSK